MERDTDPEHVTIFTKTYLNKSCIFLKDLLPCVTDSLVGMATGYALGRRGSIPSRGRDLSLLCSAQTGSGAHPASHQIGTGGDFSGGKVAWP
jgi:hypothetical protein